jgi:hypothetical protein
MRVQTNHDQMFFTTVRVAVETNAGPEYGTACLLEYSFRPNFSTIYLATAAHLLENASRGTLAFVPNDRDGPKLQPQVVEISDFQQAFVRHPNPRVDVAVIGVDLLSLHNLVKGDFRPYWHAIRERQAAGPVQFERMDSVQEIRFVGYPSGHYDRVNGLPIVRQGITASPPAIDYNGEPVFLIDAAVYFGSSGSPVFLSPQRFEKGSNLFLGILSEMVRATTTGSVENVPPAITLEALRTARLLNLGIVYKTSAIYETIQHFNQVHGWPDDLQRQFDRRSTLDSGA